MTAIGRVLLIDDNDDHRGALASALRERGWTVDTARTARLGLDLATKSPPDVVLTELILPDARGYQFARALRSAIDGEVRVIALTRLPAQLHAHALAEGFDHVEAKPVNVDTLIEKMRQG
ncbi:MAG: response regulator [Kofleriaceae bacterium]|nr:response regulator [Kofleriaceae bacterium]